MIEGLDKLLKRIERYENVSTVQGVRKGIALVQAQARAGCISETGELRNSIHVSDEVIGNLFYEQILCTLCRIWHGPERAGESCRNIT